MKEIIIIAGPNGAGKTSFANEFLAGETNLVFVNADEAARVLVRGGYTGTALDIAAGRVVLKLIAELTAKDREFVVETTLATTVYARLIPIWRASGYSVSLNFLRLASVEQALARIRHRVAAGGHSISEDIVRRRFMRGAELLEAAYKPIVNDWYIWNSLEGSFEIADSSGHDS
jgi:predicted ABC-type ATPase